MRYLFVLPLVFLGVASWPARAQGPECTPFRYQALARREPYACVRIEGTTGCPSASLSGYVRFEESGGVCGPEQGALYSFDVPSELTTIGGAYWPSDLEALFVAASLSGTVVLPETVLGVAFRHGQPHRTLRGADFGVPNEGVAHAALVVTPSPSGAFAFTLSQSSGGRFRASLVVDAPNLPLPERR